MNWHTKEERGKIREYGGIPLVKYGYDGLIHGQPVEVRSCRRDNRFRIQENVHRALVAGHGCYIFVASGRSRKVPASKVSGMLGRGKWFKDREYPHRFLKKSQVF